MDFEFVRHEPVYDRMIFVLTLDRQKMKERFEQAAPEIVRTMAIEVAARFGPQAR